MKKNTLYVRSDRLHTGNGGIPGAFRLAKSTGLPVQHMRPNGAVTIVWYIDRKRRQETYPADKVKVLFGAEGI